MTEIYEGLKRFRFFWLGGGLVNTLERVRQWIRVVIEADENETEDEWDDDDSE